MSGDSCNLKRNKNYNRLHASTRRGRAHCQVTECGEKLQVGRKDKVFETESDIYRKGQEIYFFYLLRIKSSLKN